MKKEATANCLYYLHLYHNVQILGSVVASIMFQVLSSMFANKMIVARLFTNHHITRTWLSRARGAELSRM